MSRNVPPGVGRLLQCSKLRASERPPWRRGNDACRSSLLCRTTALHPRAATMTNALDSDSRSRARGHKSGLPIALAALGALALCALVVRLQTRRAEAAH